MAPRLLIMLKTPAKASGRAVLETAEGPKRFAFTSPAQLYAQLPSAGDPAVVIGGAGAGDAGPAQLLLEYPGAAQAVWYARELAYLFGSAEPRTLKQLAALADSVARRLEEIPADLLAQMCELIREAVAEPRLGCFTAELHRRFDVLNLPAAGEVNLEAFYPPARDVGAPSRQEVAPDILERLFEAKEALAAAFTQYEERPQQIEMAQAVEQALEESQPLVVEAGTGVGKSLAYLLPVAVHAAGTGKLCLISTNTLNLQQQLVELDIPRLRQILDTLELRITLLKGREHYLCLKRLEDLWLRNAAASRLRREQHLAAGDGALLFILRLLLGAVAGRGGMPGDLDVLPAPPGLSQAERQHVLKGVDCNYATCLGERCEYMGQCHFFSQRLEAMQSHLVITNHALVFALHSTGDDEADNVVTRCSVLVLDEAHNLEHAITDQHTLEVTHEHPVELGNRLLGVLQQEGVRRRLALAPESVAEEWREGLERVQAAAQEVPQWIKLAVEVREQVDRLLMQAAEKGHMSFTAQSQLTPSTATPGQAQVLALLAKLAQRLLAVVTRYGELARDLAGLFGDEEADLYVDDALLQMDLKSLNVELRECCIALGRWEPADPQAITWFNCELGEKPARWTYQTAPLEVGPIFQPLLTKKDCTILCGATLTVADRFDYLQASLGFDEAETGRTRWLKLESPFDYKEQSLLLVATDLARPTGETRQQYLEQLEDVVAGVCELFSRGVLVLFNSWRDLKHIAGELPGLVEPSRILVQGATGTREQLAERFRREGDKVLLATRSFWEGFDVAGEALSCVVLAKLPFANYRDPIHAGRQRAIEAAGGDSFLSYSLPLAAMQLKQGFGRLIRSTRDVGCVFLLDSRAARAGYGRVFLDSLPGPRIVSGGYAECLAAARQFMEAQNA